MHSWETKLCYYSLPPSNNMFSVYFLLRDMFILPRAYKGNDTHLWFITYSTLGAKRVFLPSLWGALKPPKWVLARFRCFSTQTFAFHSSRKVKKTSSVTQGKLTVVIQAKYTFTNILNYYKIVPCNASLLNWYCTGWIMHHIKEWHNFKNKNANKVYYIPV